MEQITLEQALQIALQIRQEGRLPESEAICRQVLQLQPGNPAAWHRLGMIAYQAGNLEIATLQLGRAIALAPGMACTAPSRNPNGMVPIRTAGQS